MNECRPETEASTLSETTAKISEAARDVRRALEQGQTPGQWKAILTDLVREAPLASLAVAFMLGIVIARR
jgi:hypothetical protein